MKASTLADFYSPYCALLKAECGGWSLNRLDKHQVRAYRADLLRRPLSPNTVRNRLSVLRTVLRWGGRHDLLPHSRAEVVTSLPARRRREKIPTRAEVDRLIAAARDDVADVLVFLLNEPVRPGDAFALRVGWVDLERRLIRLPDSKTGPRVLPIVEPVVSILARRLSGAAAHDQFVFTTQTGRPWRRNYFAELVRDARTKADLGPETVAYSLRHRWSTDAFLHGLPLHAVRALRGDGDVKTTLLYEHAASHEGFLQEAARRAVGLPVPAGG